MNTFREICACKSQRQSRHKELVLSLILYWSSCMPTVFVVSCVLQAIEGFALMVKKTAQILQSFGTVLAETELPNDIQATSVLLSTHTNKKDKMKVTPLTHMDYLCVHSVFGVNISCALIHSFCLCVCVGGPAGCSESGQQAAGEHQ